MKNKISIETLTQLSLVEFFAGDWKIYLKGTENLLWLEVYVGKEKKKFAVGRIFCREGD